MLWLKLQQTLITLTKFHKMLQYSNKCIFEDKSFLVNLIDSKINTVSFINEIKIQTNIMLNKSNYGQIR